MPGCPLQARPQPACPTLPRVCAARLHSVAAQVEQGKLRMRETKGGMERATGAPTKKEE